VNLSGFFQYNFFPSGPLRTLNRAPQPRAGEVRAALESAIPLEITRCLTNFSSPLRSLPCSPSGKSRSSTPLFPPHPSLSTSPPVGSHCPFIPPPVFVLFSCILHAEPCVRRRNFPPFGHTLFLGGPRRHSLPIYSCPPPPHPSPRSEVDNSTLSHRPLVEVFFSLASVMHFLRSSFLFPPPFTAMTFEQLHACFASHALREGWHPCDRTFAPPRRIDALLASTPSPFLTPTLHWTSSPCSGIS